MAGKLKDIIIHLDYEDKYKDGKVEVNIIASEPERLKARYEALMLEDN